MKKMSRLIAIVFSVMFLVTFIVPNQNQKTADAASKVDEKVLAAQKWVNENYRGKYCYSVIAEDGHTGNQVVKALTQALQIELGFGNDSTGNFGNGTMNKCPTLSMSNPGSNKNIITILQHGLFCKGYGAYDTYGTFGASTDKAVKKLQTDAGLDGTGTVTPMIFKAILNTDGLVLNSASGDSTIRTIQQALNRKYNKYFGIMPCDGIYGRSTNQALIYALQAEEGMAVGTANGNFGTGTTNKCPSLSVNDSRSNYVKLLQYALYCNGYNPGDFDGKYDSTVQSRVREFQKFMCLSVTGNADKGTMMSLFTTCGDTSRSSLACDTATRLNSAKIQTLVNAGYKYVGRYLTNAKSGKLDKKMTDEEVKLILKAGMKIFPIYQTYGGAASYYTTAQGNEDAISAVNAALNLGIPKGSTIYFAVDYDAYDFQVTENILPYYKQVRDRIQSLGIDYNVGIYAPRNVCNRVYNAGYAKYCFVSDASKGYSGNLGYLMPKAWSFDQFKTDITVGSGSGAIGIDKVAYSGRDAGVSSQDNSLKTKVISYSNTQVEQYNYWADPVNLATGAHEIDFDLISVNGSQNVNISLQYSSNGTMKGLFGKGFSWNYESFIKEENGEINLYDNPSKYITYKLKENSQNEYITDTLGKQNDILTKEADGSYKLDCNHVKTYYYNTDGLLSGEENSEGLNVAITYGDKQITIKDSSSGQKLILYKNDLGLVTKVSDEHGKSALLKYDSNCMLVKITDVNGNNTAFTYDAIGRVLTGTDNDGVCYFTDSYDSLGRIKEQKDALDNKTTFAYDDTASDGSMKVTVTDRNGKVKTYVYSSRKQLIKMTDQNGAIISYTYDDRGNVITTTDARNNKVVKAYNQKNLLTKETDSCGNVTTYEYDEKDNVSAIQYADGGRITFTYDSFNRRKTMTDLRGTVTTYRYDSNGYLIGCTVGEKTTAYTYEKGQIKTVKNPLGNVVTSDFDEAGNLIGTTDALGNTISQINTPAGKVSTLTDALGNTTNYTFNCRNEILTKTDAKNNTITYQYDGNNNIKSMTDEKGNVTRYVYDKEDRLIKTIHPNGSEDIVTYDAAGRIVAKQDSNGNITSYVLDAAGNVLKEINAKGGTKTYTYTSSGKVKTETDQDGNTTTYTYDNVQRISEIQNPAGGKTKYTYNHAGDVLSVTDPLGQVTTYTYDAYGNKTSCTDPMGNTETYEYDLCDNLIKVTNALGFSTSYVYDKNNHLIKTIDANGNVAEVEYDKNGRQTGLIDPMGNRSSLTYDQSGNVVQKIDALGNIVETYVYDATDHITEKTDALGNTTSYEYDAEGNVTKETNALNQITTYEYNSNNQLIKSVNAMAGISQAGYNELGQITSLIGPAAGTTSFDYDSEGKKTEESTTTGGTITYTYNNLDLLKEITNARGQVTSYEYDLAGRVISTVSKEGKTTYTYDKNGNVLTVTDANGTITRKFDALNRVIECTDTNQNTVKYQYDNVGNIDKITYPDKTAVTYTYDKASRMTTVTDWNNRVTSYTYDKLGRVIEISNPDGSKTAKTYDELGNLLTLTDVTASGAKINQYEYVYDNGNRLVKEVDKVKNLQYTYEYDDLNRVLKRVKKNLSTDSETLETFSYDAACNITSSNENSILNSMAYSANNCLTEYNGNSTVFDNDGNMTAVTIGAHTTAFEYDSKNHLVKADNNTYTYDAEDYRISTNNISYAYDRQNKNLLVQYNSDGSYEKYIYGVSLIGSDECVFHYDLRGSVTAITNMDGQVTDRYNYSTYGTQTHEQGTSDTIFGYCGRDGVLTENNGLLYMRARYYSPELKRFINADVVKGSIANSNSLNRYAYVEGNPVTLIDPFGLSAEPGTQTAKDNFNWKKALEITHTVLDIAGFIPGIGDICDGINAVLYLAEGDYVNAALSAISLIPGSDLLTKTGKAAKKVVGSGIVSFGVKHGDEVVDLCKDAIKYSDDVEDAARVTKNLLPMDLQFFAKNAEKVADVETAAVKGTEDLGTRILKEGTPSEYIQDATGRWHRPDGTFASNAELGIASTPKVSTGGHGNSLADPRINYGYALVDKDTDEILKFGETLYPETRYTKAYLEENNAVMKVLDSGSKEYIHNWQHDLNAYYMSQYGSFPPLNKGGW